MIDKLDLVNEFNRIGIKKGDTLFLRISYKSLGKIEGGPKTVVKALRECIGEDGNLIATAYGGNYMSPYILKRIFQRKYVFEKGNIRNINTGIIPVLIAQEPDAHWSSHPIFPYVAVGKYGKAITDKHTPDSGPYDLLSNIRDNYNAKTLRIGGYILTGTTHISFTEAMIASNNTQRMPKGMRYYRDENGILKLKKSRQAAFCFDEYDKFFRNIILQDEEAILYHGKFLETEATLMSMKKILFLERKHINSHPEVLLCENPDCTFCPHTYSFSKHKVDYFKIRLKRILTGNKQTKVSALQDIGYYLLSLVFIKNDVQ